MTDELHGERVVLRPLTTDDAPALCRIHATPEVSQWWGPIADGFPLTDESETTRLAILHDDEVIGLIQFGEEPEPDYRHAWIDLFLDPAWHGRGLGSDAMRVVVRHLQGALGHHRVTIDPAVDNLAAVGCYENVGFRPVGVMRRAWRDPASGVWRDTLFMELVTG
jgi:aminoglycoside 6'-N-acetyltransferase